MSTRLNLEQHTAASQLHGNVLVDAGAGSGKTRTLAERFVNAVVATEGDVGEGAGVESIATITFTDKAAGELAERIRGALRDADRQDEARRVDAAWISTVHAFCRRILRRHTLEADLDPYFGIAEGVMATRLEEDAFEEAAVAACSTRNGAALFSAYGHERVRAAVRQIARALATRGLTTEDVELEETEDIEALLQSARAFFSDAHESLRACGLEASATIRTHISQCGEVVEALERVPSRKDMTPTEIAREMRAAMVGYSHRRSVKEAAELCDDIALRRDALLSSVVVVEVAPYASALLDLARTYARAHNDAKQQRGLVDFDDLQRLTLALLRSHGDVRRSYRDLFRLIMVDEFQDTDALQLSLLNELANENLCTVGDERQSIYRFRGADISVYRAHNQAMEEAGATRVALTTNYRSHPAILGFVNQVFSNESLFGAEGFECLLPGRQEPQQPRLPETTPRVELVFVHKMGRGDGPARLAECEVVADTIERLLRDFEPGDCVILMRTYTHASAYARALQARDIPAYVVGGSRFFDQSEVAHLRAFCRTVVNSDDDEAVTLFLESPLVRLSPSALWRIAHDPERRSTNGGLWAAACRAVSLGEADRSAVRRAVELVAAARARMGDVGLGETILRAVEESDYDLWLLEEGENGRRSYANVLKFARMAREFEQTGGGGMAAFIDYLATKERSGDPEPPAPLADEQASGVRIMSVHAAKGLEFPVVIAPELGAPLRSDSALLRLDCSDDSMRMALSTPSDDVSGALGTRLFEEMDARQKAEEVDEAKRLLYVACTRAEEVLVLSGAANLDKPATQNLPLAWIRRAIGEVPEGDAGRTARLAVGGFDVGILAVPEKSDTLVEDSGETAPPSVVVESRSATTRCQPSSAGSRRFGNPRLERMAYSDIAAFELCGLRFRATRLWRLGTLSGDVGRGALDFGTALHSVMRASVEMTQSLEELASQVSRRHGFDAAERARLLRAAETILGSTCWVDLAPSTDARAETPFQVFVGTSGDDGFVLAGNMDLYIKRGTSGSIIDYKTGTSGDEEELAERYRTQAQCYALAALRDGCASVRLEFLRPEVVDEQGEPQRISFEYGSRDTQRIERELREVYDAMIRGPHEPRERFDVSVCGDCPIAGTICQLRPSDSVGRGSC